MKHRIYNLLKNGYTETKKYTVEDFVKYLYPLKHIIKKSEYFKDIIAQSNDFWHHTNNENRFQLMEDISQIHRANIKDNAYFRIINRFENGDKYGIEVPQED